MPVKTHKVKHGNVVRESFSRIDEVLEIPYLLEAQKSSYKNFIEHGIQEVLNEFSPVRDRLGRFELYYLDSHLGSESKYTIKQCKEGDYTYSRPLKVKIRLVRTSTNEMIEDEVFMGDIPIITDNASFVINGAERVVVSQLVRSPSVYALGERDQKTGVERYSTQIMPSKGAWIEFKQDQNGIIWVSVDRKRKFLATILLRCLSETGTDEEILELFGNEVELKRTLDKDTCKNKEDALVDLYKRQRVGEIPTTEGVKSLLQGMFFDARKYDLLRVGRYKVNKKLSLATRLLGRELAEDVTVPLTGEVYEKGTVLDFEQAKAIQNSGINIVKIKLSDGEFLMRGNNTVDLAEYVDCDPESLGIEEDVYYPVLAEILASTNSMEERKELIQERAADLVVRHITVDDILGSFSYNLGLVRGLGETDVIDHLANRRVRCVGELLQAHFYKGILRLDKQIKENMGRTQDDGDFRIQSFLNVKPVASVVKDFFCSSQLSQFMDHHNPAAELTNKRKLSALGPGGLNRERAGFEVRDIHHTHYGRLCPIETPEGQNIGLISSFATYARINKYGFIEAPYRKVDKATGKVTKEVHYLQADEEDKYVVAQANTPIDAEGNFVEKRVTCRIKDDIREVDASTVDYMDVSPKQLISVASALIPFLENDDTARALMGSNMQRQAVPLLKPEAPIIATGIEHKIAFDSGVMAVAKNKGVVKYVSADKIVVLNQDGDEDIYELHKFERSNAGTCIDQKPIVSKGQQVEKDEVLADGPATQNGELALGRNILIGYMSWEGYNYEDAIIINEDLVKDDVFTSIHIEKYEISARDTKLGEEQITRDIPDLGDSAKDLDENGVIRIGAEVHSKDILVGRTTPKGETDLSPEERLLRAVFGDKGKEVRDSSLRMPHGQSGIVIDVQTFTRENKDELGPGVNKVIRVYVAQKRKIGVGDKMSGRHGNKGVISKVLPREDMPFLEDGQRLQIMLNPLGVPSRMNIGQVLEVHLGYVAKMLGLKIETPVFDGARESDIKELFIENGLSPTGKFTVYDGRTGEPFENPVTVGYMYMLKLCHLVDEKIHARSTGPYSLVTQQPLGGKAQFGGQRFGEMEVWALEAYGASHVLEEVLTIKSDDTVGRNKCFEALVEGKQIPEPSTPESFKVLVKEFQALGLDIRLLNENAQEVGIRDAETVDSYSSQIDYNYDKQSKDPINEISIDEIAGFDPETVDLGLDDGLLGSDSGLSTDDILLDVDDDLTFDK